MAHDVAAGLTIDAGLAHLEVRGAAEVAEAEVDGLRSVGLGGHFKTGQWKAGRVRYTRLWSAKARKSSAYSTELNYTVKT